MKKDFLISVVIPVFNSEKYITECLDSVLSQSYKNLEIIIVDDGSTDKTVELINGYKSDLIKVYSQKNSGQAIARNVGVEKATGEWIAFIDSDDKWFKDKIEMQLEYCEKYVWSHSDYYFIGDIHKPQTRSSYFVSNQSGYAFDKLVIENTIATSSVIIKKSIFQEFGGFNTAYRALQDWDLWLKVSKEYEIGYLDKPLAEYRVHSSSVSRSTRKTFPYHMEVISRIFSDEGIAADKKHLKRNALSQSCQICSQISEQEGDYIFAIDCAIKSLIFQPSLLKRYVRVVKIIIKSIKFYTLRFFKSDSKNQM